MLVLSFDEFSDLSNKLVELFSDPNELMALSMLSLRKKRHIVGWMWLKGQKFNSHSFFKGQKCLATNPFEAKDLRLKKNWHTSLPCHQIKPESLNIVLI